MSNKALEELHKQLSYEFSDLRELIQILSKLLRQEREEAQERSTKKSFNRILGNTGIYHSNYILGAYSSGQNSNSLNHFIEEQKEMQYLDRVFHKYPAIVWSSLFLNTYSILESGLEGLCKHLRRREEESIKLDDISHRGLTLYKYYLTKVIKLDLNLGSEENWTYLKAFNSLRNIIIHSNSYIKNNDKEKVNKLEEIGLRIKDDGLIRLDNKFNKSSVDIIEEFINKIFRTVH